MKIYRLVDNCGNNIKAEQPTAIYEAIVSFEKQCKHEKYVATVTVTDKEKENSVRTMSAELKDLIGTYQNFQNAIDTFMNSSHELLKDIQNRLSKLEKSCQQD